MSTQYASAVGAVRAMEAQALTSAQLNALIEQGGTLQDNTNRTEAAYAFLQGEVGDRTALEILLYPNDFQNAKAALKCLLSDVQIEEYYVKPTHMEAQQLMNALRRRTWEELPTYLRKPLEEAYGVLAETMDGQLSEAILDRGCFLAMEAAAQKSGILMLMQYVSEISEQANLRIAYRAAKLGRGSDFLVAALTPTGRTETAAWRQAALQGTEAVLALANAVDCEELAEALCKSYAQFERVCDDRLLSCFAPAQSCAFGEEPLLAYYMAGAAEEKNLRIIRICRKCGFSAGQIKERMRTLYGEDRSNRQS